MGIAHTWPDVLTSLVSGQDLDLPAARWAMDQVLSGDSTPVQIAGFAVALRSKGETIDEVSGLADAMLSRAAQIDLDREAVDVVGSGGDRANTVNVSTMAAMVAAAAGARVVKHGNRAASSQCGTADCLEALGVCLDVPVEAHAGILAELGITFLFAAKFHQALRYAASARKELGIQTTFNFLGPLANPARPLAQAVGVAHERMAPLMAGVLAGRGGRGLVFHGGDGLDELTTTTDSQVWLFRDGRIVESALDPVELGLQPAHSQDLVGGPPQHNAQVVRDLFAGTTGPVRDIVVLNAAAALLAFHGPDLDAPLVDQLRVRLDEASAAIDSGACSRLLDRWVELSQATV
ncbi:anthranilate phosphoribosyltransferase [Aestuariimicrobium sp. T2.26MG-19.2B]|uniref:anthranilate phosphoribosyltransferase n=1 Tax=Aestuariimicrobium sp. T2.26MG-19.2B TaxID=3040679 RepID=UPI00247792E2|nr:anthranilate phosphoribosyltransferase [Aestuariimicrobium sp. T2.26MG-19.2B]CAI9399694.1 Anthranilate phosphoribosyltransferase [Aestuariimicrobium sp. T2.26MG-19.2B]